MQTILIVLQLVLALGIIGLVLMQHGKGADAGAAFGSGASATVFGARGSANFLSRATAILAALFFVTSISLAGLALRTGDQPGLMDNASGDAQAPVAVQPEAAAPSVTTDVPVAPGTGAATSDVPAVPETAPAAAEGAGDAPAAPATGTN